MVVYNLVSLFINLNLKSVLFGCTKKDLFLFSMIKLKKKQKKKPSLPGTSITTSATS